MFMYSHWSGDSETLLNMLLRIMEEKQETFRPSVFIDYGYECAGEFYKTSSFVKVFYVLL